MRIVRNFFTVVFLAASGLVLAACDSPEERAEKHFQNAIALIEEGDVDRAMVELRNVFELNASHIEARRTMAELHLENGNERNAYRQLATLAELDPTDLESRVKLAEMAFNFGSWDELDRHGAQAEELAPEDPRVEAIALTRAYRTAATEDQAAERRDLGDQADGMLEEHPDNLLLRNVAMDNAIREQNFSRALAEIDWMLAEDGPRIRYYKERLRVLALLGDTDGIETQLRELVDLFPEDPEHKATLIRYLISREDLDGAEEFLRDLVEKAAPDNEGAKIDLIRFLAESGDIETAREEIRSAITESPDPLPFKILEAGFDFSEGNHSTAISTLQDVLEQSEPSDEGAMSEQTQNAKVILARMLLETGNEVGARAHVEELLAENPTHPEALKMQAAWQIESDDTDAAIAALRLVLDQRPEDAEAMTRMANAYARAGQPDLAKDYLAQAVQASGNAPAESLRYATLLVKEERYLPAEDVLVAALRLDSSNIRILTLLGELYLRMEDFGRAEGVINTLRRIGGEDAIQAANGLEAEQLNLQKGASEAIAYLEGLANEADATVSTRISVIRARLSTGDIDGALAAAKDLRDENPNDRALTVVLAVALTAARDYEAASSLYRDLLEEEPNRTVAWLRLSQLNLLKGDREEARSAVNKGLTHAPDNPDLLWAKASLAEGDGDIDTAIDIYEKLYDQNSNSVIIANNLASLLSTHRTDEASQNRAWTIGRRLRDLDVPAFQDTYGWILHKQGNSEEALSVLESAAQGLPRDPIVQYHLGQVYLELDRPQEALEQFRKSLDIAGPADSRPQIEEAKALVQSLQNTEPAQE